MKKKYIVFRDGTVKVFSKDEIHSWVAGGKEVVSAGFYDGEKAYGESTTLGVKSRPEDIDLINKKDSFKERKYIGVLAGNVMEFKDYVSQLSLNNLSSKTLVYIDRPQKLYGNRFDKIEVIGTFWHRKDAGGLYEEVERFYPHLID